jgi:tRNA-Thr(GGU) m(6)t(6)A37 methyltransferase TsaA
MADDPALTPIGVVRSTLRARDEAPRQGDEGAPDAWLDIEPAFATGLAGLGAGDAILLVTWLDRADRRVLTTHPRNDRSQARVGVFATRSPDRPNPLGLHRVTIRSLDGCSLRVGPLEAIDGTPIVDIKIVWGDHG